VELEASSRPRVPAVMLSEAAIKLMADVFGHRDLFRELPRIQHRTVLWGSQAEPVVLPHSAVVVSEKILLDHIRPAIPIAAVPRPSEWEIFSSRPSPPGAAEQRFGTRTARAYSVELNTAGEPGCWVESAEDGWLFLIGSEDSTGSLLCVGGVCGAPLEGSRLIAKQIRYVHAPNGEFPAHPRIMIPLCGCAEDRRWLACGTAALAFDPICGDGTAHAVREAVLAAAAVRAISNGESADHVFAHYESRLTAGFHRHLANCIGFYRSGGDGPWWTAELHALERGLAWCAERLARFPPFRYRLNGFQLEAVA